jgi:hypothetical protein
VTTKKESVKKPLCAIKPPKPEPIAYKAYEPSLRQRAAPVKDDRKNGGFII